MTATSVELMQLRQPNRQSQDPILDVAAAAQLNRDVACAVGATYERLYFGMPVTKAIEAGFQITRRSYFEAVESPAAMHTADVAFQAVGAGGNAPEALDVFCGTGQISWALSRSGFRVEAFEVSPIRFRVAATNLRCEIGNGSVSMSQGDGVGYLDECAVAGRRFSLVYLDPPWHGQYQYDLQRPFRLSDTFPAGDGLVRQSMKVSDLVFLKLPTTFVEAEIESFCRGEKLVATIYHPRTGDFPAVLNQVTACFRPARENEGARLETEVVAL